MSSSSSAPYVSAVPAPVSWLRRALVSLTLLLVLAGAGYGVLLWKHKLADGAAAAASAAPEPAWSIEASEVRAVPYARATTTIGTVHALQSITLRNELAGTVHRVALQSGQVIDAGAMLVEFDVAVETAELHALEAEARLADSLLGRMEQALKDQGASAADVDRARAERDKATANVARTQALIDRKKIKAPFRARVGMVDLHVGQYLEPGTQITTLQGVDSGVHVDYAVPQDIAAQLEIGGQINVRVANRETVKAKIVAIDSRVEVATRNAWIRALLDTPPLPQPGASVRVSTPVETTHDVAVVPVSALRRGPNGDFVFTFVQAPDGKQRAHAQRVVSGTTLGDDVVIEQGLKQGERVATVGSFKLFEGALVMITNGAAAPSGSKPQ